MKKSIIPFLILFSLFSAFAKAQDKLVIDLSYNGKGYIEDKNIYGTQVKLQQDDKMLVCGVVEKMFKLLRYNTDGSLDKSFGTNGVAYYNLPQVKNYRLLGGTIGEIDIDYKGRIVIVGKLFSEVAQDQGNYKTMAIWRFLQDGKIDTSFNKIGYYLFEHPKANIYNDYDSEANALLLHKDGKIVVAGSADEMMVNPNNLTYSDIVIWRFNENGTLDKTFNNIGYTSTVHSYYLEYAKDIVMLKDSTYIIAVAQHHIDNSTVGYAAYYYYSKSGAFLPNKSFNQFSTTRYGYGEGGLNRVFVQSDDKLLLLLRGPWIIRVHNKKIDTYNNNAPIDSTFGREGHANINKDDFYIWDPATAIIDAVMVNDALLISGFRRKMDIDYYFVARLTKDGKLDSTFNKGKGYFETKFHEVEQFVPYNLGYNQLLRQRDGKLLSNFRNNLLTYRFGLGENHSSLNEINTKGEILIYPNPAKDLLHISNLPSELRTLEILSINGVTVKTYDVKVHSGNSDITLQLPDLKKGIYFLKHTTNSGILVRKFVVN